MKRFLLVLALVAVSGATYVATAPGSQTASPTLRQFRALKAEVARLKTQLGVVKSLALTSGDLLQDCMAVSVPINRFGDWAHNPETFGYSYSDTDISPDPFLVPALDVTASDDATALWITGGSATCGTDINGTAVRKLARLTGHRSQPATFRGFGAARH